MEAEGNPDVKHGSQLDYSEWGAIAEEDKGYRLMELEYETLVVLLRGADKNADPNELLWDYHTKQAEIHRKALKASIKRRGLGDLI